MANHKSAIKRIRQNAKRAARNRHWKSSMRSAIKKVRTAVDEGNREAAEKALVDAVRTIDRCASRGVIHKNQASRRVSRLTRMVNNA